MIFQEGRVLFKDEGDKIFRGKRLAAINCILFKKSVASIVKPFSKNLALAVAITVPALLALGMAWNIFSEEDFYPARGSLQFYLRLSSVVRDLPVISLQEPPLYFGSSGDGAKEPQSSVTYRSYTEDTQALIARTNEYLHRLQFTHDTDVKSVSAAFAPDKGAVIHQAVLTKGTESVSFLIHAKDDGRPVIEVTHFE